MKVLRVRIRRGGAGENMMLYPNLFRSVDIMGTGPIYYSGHIARGGTEAWCICIVLDDAVAAQYAQDPDMDIITAAQADTFMEEWRILKGEPEETVNDPNRLTAILAKQGAGIALSDEDLKALDVNDPTPGINKTLKSVVDILAKFPA